MKTDDGEDDLKKGTQLLEIYALEIQMYTAQKNNKKLKVDFIDYMLMQLFILPTTVLFYRLCMSNLYTSSQLFLTL